MRIEVKFSAGRFMIKEVFYADPSMDLIHEIARKIELLKAELKEVKNK